MDVHYNVIRTEFEGRHKLSYSPTDSLVYFLSHNGIYKWIMQNKQHFDLSDIART